MARDIVLGNQKLLVNIDKWLQVRDIFFPFVGQYNHLMGHAHKICIVENNDVSWLNSSEWETKPGYMDDVLITNSTASSFTKKLGIVLTEYVGWKDNMFVRRFNVKNHSPHNRSITLCVHHDFHLYSDGIGDTAMYNLERNCIVHYKRAAYFLMGFYRSGKNSISNFDIGEKVSPLMLKKNPIAQGEVDSVMSIDIALNGNASSFFEYYMLVGENFDEVYRLQDQYYKSRFDDKIKNEIKMQKKWLSGMKYPLNRLDPDVRLAYVQSLLIIRTQIDSGGAIIAANDSDNMQFNKDTYSYMWPRDGALITIALIRSGFACMTRPFFIFCRDVLCSDGYLLHKYNPDKTLGSSWHPWVNGKVAALPIQEDETALVLHALLKYYEETKDKAFVKMLYPKLVRPAARFLEKYRYPNGLPMESYDLWEEKRGIFTFTTAAVLAGLKAGEKLGAVFNDSEFSENCIKCHDKIKEVMIEHLYNHDKGYFRKSVNFEGRSLKYDDTMDSSLYGLWEFGVFKPGDEMIVKSMQRMIDWLWVKTDVGGMARYYNDYYYQNSKDLGIIPGNPWLISTSWYARWLIRTAENKSGLKEGYKLIRWIVEHSLATGAMPEQIHPLTGEPISVAPLTWSHAEFVDTVTTYLERLNA